jgi:hypothetical protein
VIENDTLICLEHLTELIANLDELDSCVPSHPATVHLLCPYIMRRVYDYGHISHLLRIAQLLGIREK